MKTRYGNDNSNDFRSNPESERVYGLGGYDSYELNLNRVFFGSDHAFYGGKSDDSYEISLANGRISILEDGLVGDIYFDGGAGRDIFYITDAPKWASPDYLRSFITTKNVEIVYVIYGMVSGSLSGSDSDDTMAARVGYLRSLNVQLGSGDDCYFGTSWGKMSVDGGEGDDLIGAYGARGNVLPEFIGGAGNDVFQFYDMDPFKHNGAMLASVAKITDFDRGADKIMVGIDELQIDDTFSADGAIKSHKFFEKYIDFHDGMLFINDRFAAKLVGIDEVSADDFLFA